MKAGAALGRPGEAGDESGWEGHTRRLEANKAEAVSKTRSRMLPEGEGVKASWVGRASLVWPMRLGEYSSAEVLVGGADQVTGARPPAFAFIPSCPLLS